MSFSTKTTGLAKKSIVKLYPHLRKEIQQIQQEILGYAPPSYNGIRTGVQFGKKQLTSVYVNQYYEGVNIDAAARKANPGFLTEIEERRQEKLLMLRRRGKGPPKKGSGKRKKK